jgi:iron complex transport system substrate-binding protein
MNRQTSVFILAIIGLILLMLGGIELLSLFKIEPALPSFPTTEKGTASFPRELRDASGQTLVIATIPQRIVSQTLGTDEILFAISDSSRIVAVSVLAQDARYSNVVEEARMIGKQATSSAELILSYHPDLIFVASYSRAETVELLQASGAPVFRFAHFRHIADIKSHIKTIGYAIGEDKRAAALIAQMEQDMKSIRASIPPDANPPRVISYNQWGITAGSNTTFDNILRVAGARNVAAAHGVDGHIKLSSEQVIEWQADFIVTGANQGEFDTARRQLLKNPAIAASDAGKAGRIIVIDNRYFLSVSQYIIYGIKELTEKLYTVVESENENRN